MRKSLHRLQSGDIINIGPDIKMTYNYITYSTDTNDFLNYCDSDKNHYQPNNEKNYKETAVISDSQKDSQEDDQEETAFYQD